MTANKKTQTKITIHFCFHSFKNSNLLKSSSLLYLKQHRVPYENSILFVQVFCYCNGWNLRSLFFQGIIFSFFWANQSWSAKIQFHYWSFNSFYQFVNGSILDWKIPDDASWWWKSFLWMFQKKYFLKVDMIFLFN